MTNAGLDSSTLFALALRTFGRLRDLANFAQDDTLTLGDPHLGGHAH